MPKIVVLLLLCAGALGVRDLHTSFRKNYASDLHNSFEKPDNVYDFGTPYDGPGNYHLPSYSVASPHIHSGLKYKRGRSHSFGYDVLDHYAGLAFGHKQDSDGKTVTGSYDTLLPDGRLQKVTYIADENGYRANVRYEDGPIKFLRKHDSHEVKGFVLGNGPPVHTHHHPVVYQVNRRPYYVRRHLY